MICAELRALASDFDAHVESGYNPVELAVRLGAWTQGDLAKASGIEASSITRIKRGDMRMSRSHRAAILWALAGRCLR